MPAILASISWAHTALSLLARCPPGLGARSRSMWSSTTTCWQVAQPGKSSVGTSHPASTRLSQRQRRGSPSLALRSQPHSPPGCAAMGQMRRRWFAGTAGQRRDGGMPKPDSRANATGNNSSDGGHANSSNGGDESGLGSGIRASPAEGPRPFTSDAAPTCHQPRHLQQGASTDVRVLYQRMAQVRAEC
jgi:hypothetical protein